MMGVQYEQELFSGRDLRDALGLFATGVAVITAVTAAGERIGATVSSFNSVSLNPPLILFSMARNAKAFPVWQSVQHFAVNVLDERQSSVSDRFARAMTDKWTGIASVAGRTGAPILTHALACFECRRHAEHDGGDHLIIVGRVLAVNISDDHDHLPLVFFRSKYRRLDPERKIDTPIDVGHWLHGW